MADLADSFDGLHIIDEPSSLRVEQQLPSTGSFSDPLKLAVSTLVQSSKNVSSSAKSVEALAAGSASAGGLTITEVYQLREVVEQLREFDLNLLNPTNALDQAAEQSVLAHIKRLGSQSTTSTVSKLLSRFEAQIRDIIREVLQHSSTQHLLWKVAEECYKQVVSPSGKLHSDDNLDPLDEPAFGPAPTPDKESENNYEHGEIVLNPSAHAFLSAQAERRDKVRRTGPKCWRAFWIDVLNKSPNGPTLFNPPANMSTRWFGSKAVPQYLFRTFDRSSSGRNDDTVIASTMSVDGPSGGSRNNILTLDRQRAVHLLHGHMRKSLFEGPECKFLMSNLMSWTSSPLFAIQYAIWRREKNRLHPSEVKLCVVDTRKFPEEQFAQDMWFYEEYYATAAQLGNPYLKFFNFRRDREDYYNGEYLSQGLVNHEGRSCEVSLEDLMQAGLFELYPEFEAAGGDTFWTKRVRELRKEWMAESETTERDIQLALRLACNCFSIFEPIDMALLFLCFKNRNFLPSDHLTDPGYRAAQPPGWADKPDEVRRYWIASTEIATQDLSLANITRTNAQNEKLLQAYFNASS